jgi:hypothetical protein
VGQSGELISFPPGGGKANFAGDEGGCTRMFIATSQGGNRNLGREPAIAKNIRAHPPSSAAENPSLEVLSSYP